MIGGENDYLEVVPENQNEDGVTLAPSGNETAKTSADMFVAFSASLSQKMVASRLAPTYIGVRRQRPSNRTVQSAWRNGATESERQNANSSASIAFFVEDGNGNKRRMTKKEKKLLKNQLRLEKKELKQKRKLSQCSQGGKGDVEDDLMAKDVNCSGEEHPHSISPLPNSEEKVTKEIYDRHLSHSDIDNYHQFTVNSNTLEEELADLRGDRDSVPPVSLMPAMLAETERLLKCPSLSKSRQDLDWKFDEDLSSEWATEIRTSLSDSENIRNQEDMRPMAYKLVPEVWIRMRPTELVGSNVKFKSESTGIENISSIQKNDSILCNEHDWARIPIRHEMRHLDFSKSVIFSILKSRTKLHIACGAKFGSDFLLYDGPRHERHAFAGLRVWDSSTQKLPTPYDMHGFVRCLNTAGKLSLLAKVEHGNENTAKVAIVDLALEKILSAPRHSQRSITKTRRDVGKSLSKIKKES